MIVEIVFWIGFAAIFGIFSIKYALEFAKPVGKIIQNIRHVYNYYSGHKKSKRQVLSYTWRDSKC